MAKTPERDTNSVVNHPEEAEVFQQSLKPGDMIVLYVGLAHLATFTLLHLPTDDNE